MGQKSTGRRRIQPVFYAVLIRLITNGTDRYALPRYSTYYYQRTSLFDILPITAKDIVFLGNSITNGCEWHELLKNKNIKNRGISGDVINGINDRIDEILKGKPSKIFLMAGINDISKGHSIAEITGNIDKLVKKIKKFLPKRNYIYKVYCL